MHDHYNRVVGSLSKFFNNLAAIAFFLMMILVVGNVVLRLFGSPIQATYDYVEFLSTLGIGLALAYCGVVGGHISISLLMDKFPTKLQKIIDIIITFISFLFLIIVSWNMGIYAYDLQISGEVAVTTRTPIAPFVYLLAAGIGLLALVILGKLLNLFKNGGDKE